MRKTLGAIRQKLVGQLLGESVFLSFLGLAGAGFLVAGFIPALNRILRDRLALSEAGVFLILVVGLTLLTGLVSGTGPALFLSSFPPARILRGTVFPGARDGTSRLRKILVLFQFAVSIVFLVSVIGVHRQLEFLRGRNLGYQKENVVTIPLKGLLRRNGQVLKQELLRLPQVESVTSASNSLIGVSSSSAIGWEGMSPGQKAELAYNWVDYDFLKTLGLELAEGRFFSPEAATDLKDAFVVNEAAVRAMGLQAPLGKEIIRSPNSPYEDRGRIIGVLKDFHYESLRSEIRPFCLIPTLSGGDMVVRLRPGPPAETLKKIEQTIRSLSPGHPFDVRFLDEDIDELYRTDRTTQTLIFMVALVALWLSGLGLYGLAAFSTERRTREIGIRKAVGASAGRIALLLSKEFAVLAAVAGLVAGPVSWVIVGKWLRNFAYHVDPQLWMFLAAGGVVAFTIGITVARSVVKASRTNPAQSLRRE